MLNVSDLIGIPYKDNGRDKNGFDCYGLAIEVEKRLGKELKDVVYTNHNIELCDKYLPTLNVKSTNLLLEGNIVEMHIHGLLHIGVCLNDKEFIHATRNQGVRISMIKAYPITAIYEVI